MTSDPDECVRIVEELGKHCADPSNNRLRNALLSAGVRGRILAAVKPPGPWPLKFLDCEVQLASDGDGLVLPNFKGEDAAILNEEMDRLVVAWLKHRGVDLQKTLRIMRMCESTHLDANDAPGDCCEQCDLHHAAKPIQAILDNAKEAD